MYFTFLEAVKWFYGNVPPPCVCSYWNIKIQICYRHYIINKWSHHSSCQHDSLVSGRSFFFWLTSKHDWAYPVHDSLLCHFLGRRLLNNRLSALCDCMICALLCIAWRSCLRYISKAPDGTCLKPTLCSFDKLLNVCKFRTSTTISSYQTVPYQHHGTGAVL